MRKKLFLFSAALLLAAVLFFALPEFFSSEFYGKKDIINEIKKIIIKPAFPPLDITVYDGKINELANNPPPKIVEPEIDPKTNKPLPALPPKPNLWPVKTVYPNGGAILPFSRIIAYYGNLYSKDMGVLGQYEEEEMIARLKAEIEKWSIADPATPVVPALHYVTVVAQSKAGEDGKYRTRMPDAEIEKVIKMAEKINALVFLDIQIGLSNLPAEIPLLEKYLKLPQVHLGIDPEFSMKTGVRPGKIVGTLHAGDINFAADYLAKIVRENNLAPKILVVHRYTQKMVTDYKEIKPLPETQIVLNMDGWGGPAHKISAYRQFIYAEPVQFTGFKLFYKNDTLTPGISLMTPSDLLKLKPIPIYIQYQ